MALDINHNASLNLQAHLINKDNNSFDTPTMDLSLHYKNGTHIGNSFFSQVSLVSNQNFNLNNATLTNTLNKSVAFSDLKMLAIQNKGPCAVIVQGNDTTVPITNGNSDGIIIPSGGFTIISTGKNAIGYTVDENNSNLSIGLITTNTYCSATVNLLALGTQFGPVVIGTQGPKGFQGFTGPQGMTGSQGATGPQGLTGDKGFQGFTGVQGPIQGFSSFTASYTQPATGENITLTISDAIYVPGQIVTLYDNNGNVIGQYQVQG